MVDDGGASDGGTEVLREPLKGETDKTNDSGEEKKEGEERGFDGDDSFINDETDLSVMSDSDGAAGYLNEEFLVDEVVVAEGVVKGEEEGKMEVVEVEKVEVTERVEVVSQLEDNVTEPPIIELTTIPPKPTTPPQAADPLPEVVNSPPTPTLTPTPPH